MLWSHNVHLTICNPKLVLYVNSIFKTKVIQCVLFTEKCLKEGDIVSKQLEIF
jgi:hypothetical protein